MKCKNRTCSNPVKDDPRAKYCSVGCKRSWNTRVKRRALKKRAVEYKGGKCEICTYSRSISALQFHHKDSEQKEFGIGGSGETRSWEKIRKEIDKCRLLCANCHAEEHEKLDAEQANLVEARA